MHLAILRKPFHSSASARAFSGVTGMGGKASYSAQLTEIILLVQVTSELTELKATLGDVQTSLSSSLASIQGDIAFPAID